MWISKEEYYRLCQLDRHCESEVSSYLLEIRNRVSDLKDHLFNTCYGPWKVIDTTTHKDGTIVETAQRVVKKVKHD